MIFRSEAVEFIMEWAWQHGIACQVKETTDFCPGVYVKLRIKLGQLTAQSERMWDDYILQDKSALTVRLRDMAAELGLCIAR